MKRLLALILTLNSISYLSAQESPTIIIPDPSKLEEWIAQQNVPAVAIGFIENGKLSQVSAKGHMTGNQPAQSNSIFDVASLTKTITTILTLELVKNDAWNLDEPLHTFWVDPDVKDDHFHKLLTTRHVLSHRTGFANWRWMNESKKLAFDFKPGSKFQYSGEGFEYLRKALENKFDTSFDRMVDSLVFKPNQMVDSHLVWNSLIDSARFAGTFDGTGNSYSYEKAINANAADNLLTTIEDFSQLAINLIDKNLLNREIYEEMIKPHSAVRDGISFGLGWIVFNDLPNGEYALFNAGSDQGVNALIVLLPRSQRGLIVFTNGDNGRGLAMKLISETLGEAGKEILGRF